MDANKAIGGGLAGAATILIIWVFGLFHVAVPPEVASAFTTLISTGTVYFVPHRAVSGS